MFTSKTLIPTTRMTHMLRRFYLSFTGLENDAKLLILSGSISAIMWGFLDVAYAPYLDVIGQTGELIGTLMLISMLTTAVLMIPFGILADRYGRKSFLLISIVVSTFSTALYYFVTNIFLFAAAELIKGIAWAMSWGTSTAFLSEKASEKQRPYAFGLSFFGFSVGGLLGYLMGGVPDVLTAAYGIDYAQSIRLTFLATAVITFAGLFPLIPIKEAKRSSTKDAKTKLWNITSWHILSWVALTNALIGLGAGFMIPWFSYYFIKKFSVNLGEVGAVFAISQIGMAIAYLTIPKIVEKIGNVRTIVYTQGTSIMTLLLISVSPNFAVASTLYVIRVTLMNMSSPAYSSFLMGLLKTEERASGNNIAWASWNIANAIPRPIAGYIMDNIFLDMTLYICASLYSLATVIFYNIFRKIEK